MWVIDSSGVLSCITTPHVHAAYGQNATHQMTEEALAERQAALHGDAGTEESFAVDIPPKQPTKVSAFPLLHTLCWVIHIHISNCALCSCCSLVSWQGFASHRILHADNT